MSEQEVEVAEALFDLARMFTQPPPPVAEPKAETKVVVDMTKIDLKQEAKVSVASVCSATTQVPNGAVVVQSTLTAASTSGANVVGSVMSSSSVAASAASPIPSPPAAAAPVAEGTTRLFGLLLQMSNITTYTQLKLTHRIPFSRVWVVLKSVWPPSG